VGSNKVGWTKMLLAGCGVYASYVGVNREYHVSDEATKSVHGQFRLRCQEGLPGGVGLDLRDLVSIP
jgi:hypothetical protein